jgi:hypothetical protein
MRSDCNPGAWSGSKFSGWYVDAAAGVGGGEPPGGCRPAGPPMWGVVRTYGSGTGVPFVMAP